MLQGLTLGRQLGFGGIAGPAPLAETGGELALLGFEGRAPLLLLLLLLLPALAAEEQRLIQAVQVCTAWISRCSSAASACSWLASRSTASARSRRSATRASRWRRASLSA